MAPELPGFYYDDEKRKYFRIQKNHTVPNSSSAYTKQSVLALKQAREEHALRQKAARRQNDGKIKRSPLMKDLRVLEHRLGRRGPTFQETAAEEYVKKLTSRPAFYQKYNPVQSFGTFSTSSFHLTKSGRICIWSDNDTLLAKPFESIETDGCAYSDESCPHTLNLDECTAQDHDLFASLDNSLLHTEGDSLVLHTFDQASRLAGTVRRFGLGPLTESIWSLASSEVHSTYAAAHDRGLHIIPVNDHRVSFSPPLLKGREQMTVAFSEADSNLVLSGERSGRVSLTDLRFRNHGSSVLRLVHSSPVISTLSIPQDSNRILVNGLRTMSIYDLRYTKKPSLPTKSRDRPKPQDHSVPCLNFSVPRDRRSEVYMSGGPKTAYSSDLNVVVAASSGRSGTRYKSDDRVDPYKVTVYSAATGKPIDCPLSRHTFPKSVDCLNIKGIRRSGGESVLTLCNREVLEWYMHDG